MKTKVEKSVLAIGLMAVVALGAQAGGAFAEDGPSLFDVKTASVTYGPYVRLEFGHASLMPDDAYWLPPGASDPRINFDASAGNSAFGAVAAGYDWQNGIRADLAMFGTGTSHVTAPCSSVVGGGDCADHADISDASVSTRGAMLNVFYAPLEARGSDATFQPFVVGGLGIAVNHVGEWTRENLTKTRTTRVFEGDSTSNLALSVGLGASWQVTRPGKRPVLVEASWRYYDFGTASGGAAPLPGNGADEPRQPFRFDHNAQVVSFGVRIPLERY